MSFSCMIGYMFQVNSFALTLFLSALVTSGLSIYALRRKPTPGSREFGFLLASLTIWSLFQALESASTRLNLKLFWTVLSYPGSQTTAVFFFFFALRYTQMPCISRRRNQAALFILPAVSIILAATNTAHGWLWSSLSMAQHPVLGAVLIFGHGPWFWVEILYAYALLAVGLVLLLRAILIYPRVFSLQNRILLFVSFLPWVFNITYAFGSGTPRMVDFTPVAFSVSGALLGFSMFRFGFLRLAPVSRHEILERLRAGVMLVDSGQQVVYANDSFQRIFGFRESVRGQSAAALLKNWPELVEHLARQQASIPLALVYSAPGAIFRLPVSAGAETQWYEMRIQPLFDVQGSFTGWLVIANDITAQKRVEDTLHARQQFHAALNKITSAALEATDLSGMSQVLADQMAGLFRADGCYITRWDETEQRAVLLAAHGPSHDLHMENDPFPYQPTMTQAVLDAGRALSAEDILHSPYVDPRVASDYPICSMMGLPLMAGGRRLGAALISFSEPHHFSAEEVLLGEQASSHIALAILKTVLLDEAREANRRAEEINRQLQLAMTELDEMAATDPLTGAYNRNRFDELIPYEMSLFQRYGQPLSIIMFDADDFKQINDTYGHLTGDKVLIDLVKTINSNIRKSDTLIRWGGDEFLILCPGIGLEQAEAMAGKLQALIAGKSFPGAGSLTVSLGITSAQPGDTLDDLLSRADEAVYQAKRGGRNRVEVTGKRGFSAPVPPAP